MLKYILLLLISIGITNISFAQSYIGDIEVNEVKELFTIVQQSSDNKPDGNATLADLASAKKDKNIVYFDYESKEWGINLIEMPLNSEERLKINYGISKDLKATKSLVMTPKENDPFDQIYNYKQFRFNLDRTFSNHLHVKDGFVFGYEYWVIKEGNETYLIILDLAYHPLNEVEDAVSTSVQITQFK